MENNISKKCTISIEGYDCEIITDAVANAIVKKINIEKLINEVSTKVSEDIKEEILNNTDTKRKIKKSIDKVDKIVSNRINKAVSDKIEEINNTTIGSFKVVLDQ